MVMPATVLLAAVSLAATWGWWKLAAVLLIGFQALHRPSEVLFATRSHLILPGDHLSTLMIAYVRVDVPKTDRVYPKQHGKISEVLVVEFLSAMYDDYPPRPFLYVLAQLNFAMIGMQCFLFWTFLSWRQTQLSLHQLGEVLAPHGVSGN